MKPYISGRAHETFDHQIVVSETEIPGVFRAAAAPFHIEMNGLNQEGPRVVFQNIGAVTSTMVLLDPEEQGDTFQTIEPGDLVSEFSEDGDDLSPEFKPQVGMRCMLSYDEVCAMLTGLERVKARMEGARAAIVKEKEMRLSNGND